MKKRDVKIHPDPPLQKEGAGKKVLVAMSGGVDSSVAAALLVDRGYDVSGAHMKLGDFGSEKEARAVAKKLNIDFKVYDLRKEFQKEVVDYFLREFASGRTPNPCVVCNQEMKFGVLFREALKMGYDFVATGHYARILPSVIARSETTKQSRSITAGSRCFARDDDVLFRLYTAKDKTKDQSYFLYNLTQKQLGRLMFPLGDYKKGEVFAMAKKWDLPHKLEESVDVCFIGNQDHREFLKKHIKPKPGKIIDTSGKVLGEHKGLIFYTYGQRAEIGGPGPFYVVDLDMKNNNLVVTNNPRDDKLYRKSLVAKKVNWITGEEPKLPLSCRAKIRYGHEAMPCLVSSLRGVIATKQPRENTTRSLRGACPELCRRARDDYQVEFKTPQRAVTPGQSVVFYRRNEVLGGGVINLW